MAAHRHKRSHSGEKSVFVHNLLPIHSALNLADYFNRYGSVTNVTFKNTYAFVEFHDSQTVQTVLSKTNHNLYGHPIHVKNVQSHKKPTKVAKIRDNKTDVVALLKSQTEVGTQMKALLETVELSSTDIDERMKLIELLKRLLVKEYPDCTLSPFGSSANGFGMKGCDLDLFLDTNPFPADSLSPRDGKALIERVCHILRRNAMSLKLHQVFVIPSARCPIVRFVYAPLGMNCDVSAKSRLVMSNTSLLRMYADYDPCVKILVYTVRYWAQKRHVTGSATALSSYALTLMVMIYLQKAGILPSVAELSGRVQHADRCYVDEWDASFDTIPPRTSPISPHLYADMLRGFFKFYGNLDLSSVVISTRSGQCIPHWKYYTKQYAMDTFPPSFKVGEVTIQDPIALDHNIAQNINRSTRISIEHEFTLASIKVLSDSFEHRSSENWGVALLLSDIVPNDCKGKVTGLTEESWNVVTIPFAVTTMENEDGKDGDVRVDWLVHTAEFVVNLLDVLQVECLVTRHEEWVKTSREALKQHEPQVEVLVGGKHKWNEEVVCGNQRELQGGIVGACEAEIHREVVGESKREPQEEIVGGAEAEMHGEVVGGGKHEPQGEIVGGGGAEIHGDVGGSKHEPQGEIVGGPEAEMHVDVTGEEKHELHGVVDSHSMGKTLQPLYESSVESQMGSFDQNLRGNSGCKIGGGRCSDMLNSKTVHDRSTDKAQIREYDVPLVPCNQSNSGFDSDIVTTASKNLSPESSRNFKSMQQISIGTESSRETQSARRHYFDYATLKCVSKYRFWEKRNSTRTELAIVENRPKDLDLERELTEVIKTSSQPMKNPIEFTCNLKFVIGTATTALQVIFNPEKQPKEFPFAFLNKYIPWSIRNFA